jgi:hypothetical protein
MARMPVKVAVHLPNRRRMDKMRAGDSVREMTGEMKELNLSVSMRR